MFKFDRQKQLFPFVLMDKLSWISCLIHVTLLSCWSTESTSLPISCLLSSWSSAVHFVESLWALERFLVVACLDSLRSFLIWSLLFNECVLQKMRWARIWNKTLPFNKDLSCGWNIDVLSLTLLCSVGEKQNKTKQNHAPSTPKQRRGRRNSIVKHRVCYPMYWHHSTQTWKEVWMKLHRCLHSEVRERTVKSLISWRDGGMDLGRVSSRETSELIPEFRVTAME